MKLERRKEEVLGSRRRSLGILYLRFLCGVDKVLLNRGMAAMSWFSSWPCIQYLGVSLAQSSCTVPRKRWTIIQRERDIRTSCSAAWPSQRGGEMPRPSVQHPWHVARSEAKTFGLKHFWHLWPLARKNIIIEPMMFLDF